MERRIQVFSSRVNSMTKEFLRFQTVIHIVVALKLVNTKDMESLFGKMEANIKDNTLTVREMDMGF